MAPRPWGDQADRGTDVCQQDPEAAKRTILTGSTPRYLGTNRISLRTPTVLVIRAGVGVARDVGRELSFHARRQDGPVESQAMNRGDPPGALTWRARGERPVRAWSLAGVFLGFMAMAHFSSRFPGRNGI
jgi:hypothetical protein